MPIANKIENLKVRLAAFRRRTVAHLQCHYCGYQPPEHAHARRRCPKCLGGAWEQPGRKPHIRTTSGD
ncbi:MAG: hypothetical protein JWP03_5521 [Phycisphaerales bacterium]|jgi:primosomal protein N'|nr:hypothetical protein [Phycisphaerales bacterium]